MGCTSGITGIKRTGNQEDNNLIMRRRMRGNAQRAGQRAEPCDPTPIRTLTQSPFAPRRPRRHLPREPHTRRGTPAGPDDGRRRAARAIAPRAPQPSPNRTRALAQLP